MKPGRFVMCGVTISLTASFLGCEDSAVIESLKLETSKLSEQVERRNEVLSDLAREVENCETDLAKAQHKAPVVQSRDPIVAMPRLIGDEDVEGLTRYKERLQAVLEEQEQKTAELGEEKQRCLEGMRALVQQRHE